MKRRRIIKEGDKVDADKKKDKYGRWIRWTTMRRRKEDKEDDDKEDDDKEKDDGRKGEYVKMRLS